MTDKPMTLDRAVHVVASQIFANAAPRADWQDYPDIGESDWELVVKRALLLAGTFAPYDHDFVAAYAFLTDRAAGVEA